MKGINYKGRYKVKATYQGTTIHFVIGALGIQAAVSEAYNKAAKIFDRTSYQDIKVDVQADS